MKIQISSNIRNDYPKKGLLLKGDSLWLWLKEIQGLNLTLEQIKIYPISSLKANELYGCFVYTGNVKVTNDYKNHTVYQSIHDYIFIPEYSSISPKISAQESEKVFETPHIYHPDFGWFELNESLDLQELISLPAEKSIYTFQPKRGITLSRDIKSFQVYVQSEDDILKSLDLKLEKDKVEELSKFEKSKLLLFSKFFSHSKSNGQFMVEKKGFLTWLDKLNSSSPNGNTTASKWEKNLQKLLYRNQLEADRLLDLFKSNPSMALNNSIPIDSIGASRDNGMALFQPAGDREIHGDNLFEHYAIILIAVYVVLGAVYLIFKLFLGVSSGNLKSFGTSLTMLICIFFATCIFTLIFSRLFGGRSKGKGGTASLDDDRLEKLREEYEKMAQNFVAQKNYHKAAGIYVKLLKDYYKAAEVLAEGGYYQEAATIHLKFSNNKHSAAENYAKGKFYKEAIKLYKELNEHEKVGDLYLKTNHKVEADKYFKLVINEHHKNKKYILASVILKEKMDEHEKAQQTLLAGWRDKKAPECLLKYFGNIDTIPTLKKHITQVYENETSIHNGAVFLRVLKSEFKRLDELKEHTKEIAYDIIAKRVKKNPKIVNELKFFNPEDKLISKDVSHFINKQ